jgi:hypothetical protein
MGSDAHPDLSESARKRLTGGAHRRLPEGAGQPDAGHAVERHRRLGLDERRHFSFELETAFDVSLG